MRLYRPYLHPRDAERADRPPVLVKEGFSWPCLILGWVGLLLQGSWITGLLAGGSGLALAALLRPVGAGWIVLVVLHVLLAWFGNDLRGWELRLRGLLPGPLVGGRGAEDALLRLLDRRPELFGAAA